MMIPLSKSIFAHSAVSRGNETQSIKTEEIGKQCNTAVAAQGFPSSILALQ